MPVRIFSSKSLVFFLILSLLNLVAAENSGAVKNKKNIPVVKVKEAGIEYSSAQKELFEGYIKEGLRLFQEEMDYEGAVEQFSKAKETAVTGNQKGDAFFYLSLVYFTIKGEGETEEFRGLIQNVIKFDYFRELDSLLCPPRYIELYAEIKEEYGALLIRSDPLGADVFLNGEKESAGKTPVTLALKAGEVLIEIKKGRKKKSAGIRIEAGKKTVPTVFILRGRSYFGYILGGIILSGAAVSLLFLGNKEGRPSIGNIQVSSVPSNADVFLDGEDTGLRTNCTLSDVSPGVHTIRIVKEGYIAGEENVRVIVGQTETVNITLESHTISVINPTRETVWILGEWEKVNWTTDESTSLLSNSGIALNSIARSHRSWLFYPQPFDQTEKGQRSGSGKKRKGRSANLNLKSTILDRTKSFEKSQRRENQNLTGRESPFSKKVFFPPSRFILSGGKNRNAVNILALSNVRIDLFKGSDRIETIIESTQNLGEYLWTVPDNLETGSDYKVRVSCPFEGGIFGESENFSISYAFEFVASWGSQGSGDGQFDKPKGIAVDSSGFIYVADSNNHRIQKFTPDGTFVSKWGSRGTEDGQFNQVDGVAADGDGFIYVADTRNHRVQKFSPDGAFVTKWGGYGQEDGLFDNPCGIAVSESGYVFVADNENHRIQRFSSDGAFLLKWGEYGTAAGQLRYPAGITVGSGGYVYVADSGNDRVQKFRVGGNYVGGWGNTGEENGQFSSPRGITIDASRFVYVSDHYNHRIQKFSHEGELDSKLGVRGDGDYQFDRPYGLAVDSLGNIYITDSNNHRVVKYRIVSSVGTNFSL
jgi:DNA-binding beta-propeller fold protein YncE